MEQVKTLKLQTHALITFLLLFILTLGICFLWNGRTRILILDKKNNIVQI